MFFDFESSMAGENSLFSTFSAIKNLLLKRAHLCLFLYSRTSNVLPASAANGYRCDAIYSELIQFLHPTDEKRALEENSFVSQVFRKYFPFFCETIEGANGEKWKKVRVLMSMKGSTTVETIQRGEISEPRKLV